MKEEYTEREWRALVRRLDECGEKNRRAGVKKVYAFLDFDGVINVFHEPGTPEFERLSHQDPEHFNFADPVCVKRFSRLAADYDMDVVISSSWRYAGLKYCRSYLLQAGLDEKVRITGVTDEELHGSREKKITDYLSQRMDFAQYLIFDDILMKHLRGHLLHCDCRRGYTEELDRRARTILKGIR